MDSLEKRIETFYITFETQNFVYESFKNSQITEFGDYEYIIKRMQAYYIRGYGDLRDYIKNHNNSVDLADNYWRYVQNDYEFSYGNDAETSYQTIEERKKKLIQLIHDPKTRNILKIDIRRKNQYVERLEQFMDFTQRNIDLINNTLKLSD